jgi:hypothetical protein
MEAWNNGIMQIGSLANLLISKWGNWKHAIPPSVGIPAGWLEIRNLQIC